MAGIQQLAGDATLLYYLTEEAQGGPERLPREAQAGLLASSRASRERGGGTLAVRRPGGSGCWPRGRATLPAAVVPVLVGTAAAAHEGARFAALAFAGGARSARC